MPCLICIPSSVLVLSQPLAFLIYLSIISFPVRNLKPTSLKRIIKSNWWVDRVWENNSATIGNNDGILSLFLLFECALDVDLLTGPTPEILYLSGGHGNHLEHVKLNRSSQWEFRIALQFKWQVYFTLAECNFTVWNLAKISGSCSYSYKKSLGIFNHLKQLGAWVYSWIKFKHFPQDPETMLKHLFSKGSGEQACRLILTLPSFAEFSCMMPFPIQVITRCDHALYMRSDDSSPAYLQAEEAHIVDDLPAFNT